MIKTKIRNFPVISVHYKIWLESAFGEGIMGDGKWKLLQAINEKGSLSAAANSIGISYRKAWGDIKKAEMLLGSALIVKQRGGALGGASTLTEFGMKWLELYKSFHSNIDKVFKNQVALLLKKFENIN